jgi:hypothetical protein
MALWGITESKDMSNDRSHSPGSKSGSKPYKITLYFTDGRSQSVRLEAASAEVAHAWMENRTAVIMPYASEATPVRPDKEAPLPDAVDLTYKMLTKSRIERWEIEEIEEIASPQDQRR